jgi:hypothetical protein
LELLAEINRRVDVPLVPMTYGAIVEGYGEEAFCRDAAAAGAEGLIVADIPPEESGRLRDAAEAVEVAFAGVVPDILHFALHDHDGLFIVEEESGVEELLALREHGGGGRAGVGCGRVRGGWERDGFHGRFVSEV